MSNYSFKCNVKAVIEVSGQKHWLKIQKKKCLACWRLTYYDSAALQSNCPTYPHRSLLTECNSVPKLTLQSAVRWLPSDLLCWHNEEQHFLLLVLSTSSWHCLTVLFYLLLTIYRTLVLRVCIYACSACVLLCQCIIHVFNSIFITLLYLLCRGVQTGVCVCVCLERLIGIHCSPLHPNPPPGTPPPTPS